jgi:RecA/RadA recombinase
VSEVAAFNPYGESPSKILDGIEKNVGLSDGSLNPNEKRLPTGLLCLDLVLGGGLTAGWYTNVGPEQVCKTTTVIEILLNSLGHKIPFKYYFDFEGSGGGAPQYIENIAEKKGIKMKVREIFGEKDNKGNWIHKPKIRYRDESVAEKFFDVLAQLERKLPDKRLMGDKWYYIYDPEKQKDAKSIVGEKYDKKYYQSTKKYRVEAEDGSLQAFILLDSYPAMLPEAQDVDDPKSGMAAQARMFSEQLKRVKGRLRGKRILVYGINQLRLKPMVMFGPPEYEPCGEALKLYSDVRMRFSNRALSALKKAGYDPKGDKYIEEERSVTGEGKDNYRYIHVRAHKNKFSVPDLQCFLRLWINDENGEARGFDPVFDTYAYLKDTGQLKGKRNSMTLGLRVKDKKRLVSKSIDWATFKKLILGDRSEIKEICLKNLKFERPLMLRDFCEKQIQSGKGIEYYFEYRKNAIKEKEEEGDGEDSEE